MFGQQFSNPFASAARWIFFGFFGIILMAIILGANFKDATWLNSDIAAAEANRINIENAHQQASNELQERLASAKTDAEIRDIQRAQALADAQYNHDIQALQQNIEHNDIAFKAWMTILIFIGGAISIAIMLVTVIWAASKFTDKTNPKQAATTPATTIATSKMEEETKKLWKERREWARNNEEWFRTQTLMEARLKAATHSKVTDKNQRNNLPLAI